MRSRSTSRSRGRDAFAAGAARAPIPSDADPMRTYQPGWTSSGGWSGRDFGSALRRRRSRAPAARWPAPCRCRPAPPAFPAGAAAPAAAVVAAAVAAGRRGRCTRVTSAGRLARQARRTCTSHRPGRHARSAARISVGGNPRAHAGARRRRFEEDGHRPRWSRPGLVYEGAKAFATPRRLALTVHGVPARQPDIKEEKQRPARRRARTARSPASCKAARA